MVFDGLKADEDVVAEDDDEIVEVFLEDVHHGHEGSGCVHEAKG